MKRAIAASLVKKLNTLKTLATLLCSIPVIRFELYCDSLEILKFLNKLLLISNFGLSFSQSNFF